LISVAVDGQGARAARRWVQASGATYPTLVDSQNTLGALVDARAIPNGIFLDEQGVVRYLKLGGFSVDELADVAAIKGLLHGGTIEAPRVRPDDAAAPAEDVARSHALFAAGALLLEQGQPEQAVERWQEALALDPDSWIIRKQIWAVRYPERFHPTIDWAWQREQVVRERGYPSGPLPAPSVMSTALKTNADRATT